MTDESISQFHYKKAKKLLAEAESEEYASDREAKMALAEIHLQIWEKTRSKPRDPYRLGWA